LGDWKIGLLGVFDLNQKRVLRKDFLLGYIKNAWEVYLQGTQDEKHRTKDWTDITQWFTGVSLTALHRRNIREAYGVEVNFNVKSDRGESSLEEYQPSISSGLI
jgi:hypothetical protein